jgi:hypothetical protein
MNVRTAPAYEGRNEADIMREDEDQFRYYVPLLRRIIILVAVITAIPVILWTITAFVRTYVAPPKVPTFRPMTATASIASPPAPETSGKLSAAPQGATAPSASPMVEARATATDAREAAPPAKGPLLADHPADVTANIGAGASAPKAADVNVTAAATAPADATPKADTMVPMKFDGPPQTGAATAAQQPPGQLPGAIDATADALPAAAPLSGPIPLPRRRPHSLAVAQLGVPVPRPRPDATSDSGETTGANPLNWIRNIFQPQSSPQQSDQQ